MSKTGVWIPIEIWKLSELTLLERYIYSDIFSFNKVGRVYFKTNSKLAEECNCSNASITRAISTLIKLDHIKVKQSSPVRKLVPNQIDEAPKQIDEPPRQIDAHISKVISKGISKRINKVIKEDVVFPFKEDEFLDTWKIWIEERRELGIKKYTNRGEQSALHKLQKISNHDYKTAIAIINESISNGWRGLFELKGSKQDSPGHNLEEAIAWAYKKR